MESDEIADGADEGSDGIDAIAAGAMAGEALCPMMRS